MNGESKGQCRQSSNHIYCVALDDDSLRWFWEIEQYNLHKPVLSPEEKIIVQHFDEHHTRDKGGTCRFIFPLPRKANIPPFGEFKTQALRKFTSMELLRKRRALSKISRKLCMSSSRKVMQSRYLWRNWTPCIERCTTFPCMHAAHKEDSTTSKLRIVFDASAKTTPGTSLNDHLVVGPTVYPALVDILLRFRKFRKPLTTDVSRLYRAIKLADDQKDLHRFVCRENPRQPIQ